MSEENSTPSVFEELQEKLLDQEMTLEDMDKIVLASTGHGQQDSIYQCGVRGLMRKGEGSCDYGRIGQDCYTITFDVLEDNSDTSKIWIKIKEIELL